MAGAAIPTRDGTTYRHNHKTTQQRKEGCQQERESNDMS
jgi:hypothetical protein